MNRVNLIGKLVRDPDIRYSQGTTPMAVAKFTLAVDRKFKKQGDEQTADFLPCIAFGKTAEFVEKWFAKGMRAGISGHLQTGNYTNKDGVKVYTTDVIIDDIEFTESKKTSDEVKQAEPTDFMNIPDGVDELLPFN